MTALEAAISQIGTKESPAGSNRTVYGKWYGWDGVPWCVIFVQWCFSQAGTPLPYKTASCTALLEWYRKNYPRGVVTAPEAGDLVIYKFSSGYHIGIVEKVTDTQITSIEGNTSLKSDDNGGSVMRRTRSRGLVHAFIRPQGTEKTTGGGGAGMNTVKGSTASETAMIKAIQTAAGADADGEIGTQTMSDIACLLRADCFPLTLKIYGAPVIIARDIVPFAAGGARLADYSNTINGSFYAGGKPCSILVQDGLVRHAEACHASYGKPESVLYRTAAGEFGITRAVTAKELTGGLSWAVGGMGLLSNYNPTLEGFCKLTAGGKTEDFSDVLRKTNHAVLGVKNGYCYLVYCANMTASEVNAFAKKLGLKMAIMLDGGHVAGINGAEGFAKINTSTKQYYMIQGVK